MVGPAYRGIGPMLELRLTDLELQRLLAPALKKRLRQEGFRFGASETPADGFNTVLLPIRLDLADEISISRDDDGVWSFQQSDPTIARRFMETFSDHFEAVAGRESPRPSKKGGDK
jgi:hypothetical protein